MIKKSKKIRETITKKTPFVKGKWWSARQPKKLTKNL